MAPRARKTDSTYQPVAGLDFLELNTANGFYYVRKYRAGKGELFKSTRSKKRGEAKTIAEDMIATWLGTKLSPRRRARLAPLADEFLAECKRLNETLDKDGHPLRRFSTYKHDMSHLKLLKEYFGEAYVDEIDEQFWEDWLRDTGLALNRTLGDVRKYLSLVLGLALRKKLILRKPVFSNPDKGGNSAVVYEDEQLLVFLKHAKKQRIKDMIVIMSENPLRPYEVRQMHWGFVTFEKDGTAVLRLPEWFTKTRKYRELALSPNASKVLSRLWKARGRDGSMYVFPSPTNPAKPVSDAIVSRDWRQAVRGAGVSKRYLFHWIRHSTYSKLLLDAEVPVQHVSEAGGTSIRVLQQRYLKSNHKRTQVVGKALKLNLS